MLASGRLSQPSNTRFDKGGPVTEGDWVDKEKFSAVRLSCHIVCRRGQIAEAEPALPGWRMPVDDLFL